MADPTAIVTAFNDHIEDVNAKISTITSAEALVIQGLISQITSTGKSVFCGSDESAIPAGIVTNPVHSNGTLTGDSGGTYKAVSRGGLIIKNAPVTGVTAATDEGKQIYATDGQTLTLSVQTVAVPVGIVTQYRSTGYADVYLYSFVENAAFKSFCLPQYDQINLGYFGSNGWGDTSAHTLWIRTMKRHFKILTWHFQPTQIDNACVAGAQTLNLEIGGTTVKTTGGVNPSAITLAYTSFDAIGDVATVLDGSTVVSANEVHRGDVLEVVMPASGTGFTADLNVGGTLWLEVEYLPGS